MFLKTRYGLAVLDTSLIIHLHQTQSLLKEILQTSFAFCSKLVVLFFVFADGDYINT